MNISKIEQRALHVLAQGGAIHYMRGENRKITSITCVTRANHLRHKAGHILTDCVVETFTRLKKRRFIKSSNGLPYCATRARINVGINAALAQMDNR